jgi:hypothetical protein
MAIKVTRKPDGTYKVNCKGKSYAAQNLETLITLMEKLEDANAKT